MFIEDLLDDFYLDQISRGNSEKTLIYYRSCLSRFLRFTGDCFEIKNLTSRFLKSYTVHLTNTEITSVSVQSYVRGLRAFLNWLYDEKYINEKLTIDYKLPRASRQVIDVLSDDEISRILTSLSGSDWLSRRNLLIISLMLDSGLRLSEAINLQNSHINLSDRYLIVNGKGNKQRIVPFGNFTYNALTSYLSSISSSGPQQYLLIKVSKIQFGFDHITEATVKNMFRRLRSRADVPRLYPHLLRHTFATRYLENGGNIYTLQAILGHSSLEMVKKYLHLATNRIRSDFPKFSPLDNIKKDLP